MLTDRFPPSWGSRSATAVALAQRWSAAGHHVTIAYPKLQAGPVAVPVFAGKVKLAGGVLWGLSARLGRSPRNTFLRRLARVFEFVAASLHATICGKHDLIVVNRALPLGSAARAVARVSQCPFVVILHGDEVAVGRWGPKTHELLRQLLSEASSVRCPTQELARGLAKIAPDASPRLHAVAPEVAWTESPSVSERQVSPDPLVLAPARFVGQKGLDTLLLAWREVVNVLPSARLRLVGDGPQAPALAAQVSSLGLDASVEIRKPVADIRTELFPAWLVALPTRVVHGTADREGSGTIFREAALLGIPSIGGIGAEDRILHGKSGYVMAGNASPSEVARLIVGILNDADLRARMGEAARAHARQEQEQIDVWSTECVQIPARHSTPGGET